MQPTMPRRSQIRVLAALILAIIATPAFSYDGKVYPGTMCQPVTDGFHAGPSNASNLQYQLSGGVLNGSTTSWMEVTCPLVRDVDVPASGIGDSNPATVFLYNASNVPAKCTFFSNSYYSMGWLQTKTQSQMGPGIKVISFSAQDNNFVVGNYNIWCSIPPSTPRQLAGIFQYWAREKE
jgi:hypothetical protein